MLAILLLWILMLLYGVKKNKIGSPPMEREQSVALRGICAVEIMIGHIGLLTGNPVLYPNRKAGILFVGLFLMLSGYGVAYGADHKEKYLNHFIARKLAKLLLPAYITYAVYMTALILIFGETGWNSLFDIAGFFQKTNWYVWEQLAFYIIFCFAYTVIPKRANLLIGLLSVGFVGIAFGIGIDVPYYGSTLCFALGLYYYQFEEMLTRAFREKFLRMLMIFGGGGADAFVRYILYFG